MTVPARPDLTAVSIVVLSYNRKDDLRANLRNLLSIVDSSGCELIVVDNGSSDGSPAMVAELLRDHPNARFFLMAENLGVGGGRNVGWRHASREFILNIDDDTIVDTDAIAVLLSRLRATPSLAIVSPQILHARTGARQMWFENKDYRPTNFHGACHLVRRSTLEAIGFNDEECTFGGEELDLSLRARAAGFEVGYVGDAVVLHNNFQRVAAESKKRRTQWLTNYARIHHKFFPPSVALLLTTRFLVGHIVSGVRAHGPSFSVDLLCAANEGRKEGRRAYHPVPLSVLEFYLNPDLRPEFGNVPLWKKAIRVLCGRWRK